MSKRVCSYILLCDYRPDLATEVMDYLSRGYELYGTPFPSGPNNNNVTQAMVMYSECVSEPTSQDRKIEPNL